MTLSAAIMAAAGGCSTRNISSLSTPASPTGPWISIEALLAPIIGGVGTVFGPLLGALAVKRSARAAKLVDRRCARASISCVYGAVLVLIVAFAPRGLAGVVADVASGCAPPRKPAREATSHG